MSDKDRNDGEGHMTEMTFVEHLVELRDRLLRVVLTIVVFLLLLFPFANDLYHFLATPLLAHLPEGTSMIATQVASPFLLLLFPFANDLYHFLATPLLAHLPLTPFKLALVVAIFISMPMALYHLWAFVAPGLYKKEQRLVFPLMATSSLLFYLGMAFAYYVVFPLMFAFFHMVAPDGVAIMTDITAYLDFVLKIFFAFGIAFEVPIATILLVWTGFTSVKSLRSKRPYVIVGAFVFGMLLTPPDMISQTLLALPMWVLFELGLVFAKLYVRTEDEEEEEVAGAS